MTVSDLKVVFDSSAIYTQVAHELFRDKVRETIKQNSSHADLLVEWFLPSVVIEERRFQMYAKAAEFLPTLEKLYRLLGHNLGITEGVLQGRVDQALAAQLKEYNVAPYDLNTSRVSWQDIIQRALRRQPPFEAGKTEKGFRDALVLETYLQLLEDSPASPAKCLVALVADDKTLTEAARERTRDRRTARVFKDDEQLRGLINTLVSNVPEDWIQKFRPRARDYFFAKKDESSLYYREHVRDRITEEYGVELRSLPEGAATRENGTWLIAWPEFVSKQERTYTWSTIISIETTAYGPVSQSYPIAGSTVSTPGLPGSTLLDASGYQAPPGTVLPMTSLAGLVSSQTVQAAQKWLSEQPRIQASQGREVATGTLSFEVLWSVKIASNGRFSGGKVNEIRIAERPW